MSFVAADYASWNYSNDSALLSALYNQKGVRGIGRYYAYCGSLDENVIGGCTSSSYGWKVLTKAEADTIHSHGIKLWTVFETTNTSSHFTYAQGQNDCHQAVYLAEQTGQPSNSVIFFAVDRCDNQYLAAITDYFNGVIDYMTTNYANKYGVGAYCDSYTFNYLKSNLTNPQWLGTYWHECGTVGTPQPAIKQYNGSDGTYQWFWNPNTQSFDATAQSGDYTIDIDEVYDVYDANGYNIYW